VIEVTQGIASSALYWPADEVGSQTPGRLRAGDLSLRYTSCHIPSISFRRNPPSLEVVIDQVVWGIFWKVFSRSCGPPTRSVGPTNRSVGLLVGRTHLSGTAVSLVGGHQGVPMSHTTGSLERSLLVLSTPVGLTGDDLSRLFFTCTNTSQAATCTCNT
jgi:hypothetical protein